MPKIEENWTLATNATTLFGRQEDSSTLEEDGKDNTPIDLNKGVISMKQIQGHTQLHHGRKTMF